jgi:large subunit ribosomal protein L25
MNMRITFQVGADSRHDQGKGASRRLRRAGKVPAVLYGGKGEPRNITLDHQQLLTLIDNEKFYSSIISVNVDAQGQPAIVRDVQMHPAKNAVVHVDLQRVLENEKLKIHLPIHFKGEAMAPGVKTQGGIVSHLIQDVEVSCLPKDLPEFLELDLSAMNLNDTLHLGCANCRRASRCRSWRIAIRWWYRCTARVLPSPSRRPWRRPRRARLQAGGVAGCRGRGCGGGQEGRAQEGGGEERGCAQEGRQEVAPGPEPTAVDDLPDVLTTRAFFVIKKCAHGLSTPGDGPLQLARDPFAIVVSSRGRDCLSSSSSGSEIRGATMRGRGTTPAGGWSMNWRRAAPRQLAPRCSRAHGSGAHRCRRHAVVAAQAHGVHESQRRAGGGSGEVLRHRARRDPGGARRY